MRPIPRVALSMAMVLTAYGGYSVTAVPLIEPPLRAATEPTPSPLSSAPAQEIDPTNRMYRWFGPDRLAWELQKPKMLRNDQGILLFDKYESDPQKLGPRKVRLDPVSLVFLSKDEKLDPQVRDRQAVILRARHGAVLEFDRPFSILRGDVGNLVGGTLTGPVEIRSEGASPGPEDDWRIVTYDVNLTRTAITSSHRVDFEYGPNSGRGTGLDIRLLPEEEARPTAWGRLQKLTISRDIELKLFATSSSAGRDVLPLRPSGYSPESTAREFSPEQPIVMNRGDPVNLKCLGPLVFEADRSVATFQHQVVVTRQPAGASSSNPDTLTCHELELHLASASGKKSPSPQPSPQGGEGEKSPPTTPAGQGGGAPQPPGALTASKAPKVEVRRVVALGRAEEPNRRRAAPAVLNAPAYGAHATGQRLEYDLETRRVSLIDGQEAVFRHNSNEIHARELHYQPGPDGRLGCFEAQGAGWLNWATRDVQNAQPGRAPPNAAGVSTAESHRFLARWSRMMFSRPSEGRQAVSMLGNCKAQVTGMGRLDADEIHVWLIEQLRSITGDSPQQKPKYDFLPDRMEALAGGKDAPVVIDSPQVTGRTEKLVVFVQHPAGATANAAMAPADARNPQWVGDGTGSPGGSPPRPGQGPASGPSAGGGAPRPRDGSSPSPQRIDVTGRRMQLQLAQTGRETEWRQIDIFGGARLQETQTAKPGERPLQVTGEFLHATQSQPDAAEVTVTGVEPAPNQPGKPAHVEGRGLSLTGERGINLNQETNKVWIDGPGLMTLIVDRDLQGGKLAQPSPVDITWRGGMTFDGQRAIFDRDALVRQQDATLRTQTLEAILSRRIDLAHPQQPGAQQPQIDRVICRNGLFLDRTTRDERGPLAHERLQASDLNLDQVSGAILANGPGWLTRVSRRDAESPLAPGGLGAAPAGPAAAKTPPPPSGRPPMKAPTAASSPFAAPADPDKPLDYLRVDFQADLRGNLQQRVIMFRDQVLAVHAPVRNWDDTANPDRIESLGPRGAVLKCDELQINELRGPRDAKWFEAVAKGNANVEGETFTAQADRLNYSQEKDLLVLQGTDRAPADLWRQEGPGAPRSHLAARKVEFWRRDNHIKIDKAPFLDVDNIPADKGRSRPKPSGR